MMKNYIKIFFCAFCVFCVTSCKTIREIPYFQNADEYQASAPDHLYDMTIKPKDELFIFVHSANREAATMFNIREPAPINMQRPIVTSRGARHHYKVENDGTIEFPIIGRINVVGLTIEQVNDLIKGKIATYFTEDANYSVHTYIINYDISVLGEVKHPNTFTIQSNKVNVLEALAMAGDLTIYGTRTNVKLLRELPNGEYEIHQLDLTDANIVKSPYYYMHQRDILYVEPNSVQAQNSMLGRTKQLWIRGIQITLHLGSLLYRVLD